MLRDALSLVKPAQSALLVLTALAGYASGGSLDGAFVAGILVSMSLAVAGSTVLNMVIDRDIDAIMARTRGRPLPGGRMRPGPVLFLGIMLSVAGLALAARLSWLYAALILCGLFIDVFVYSLMLKRKTPWSIVFGGVSGGMPVLAGRALATGRVDTAGILLALGILFWIPTHIMSLTMNKLDEYKRAGVPSFPDVYGRGVTETVMSLSTILAIAAFLGAARLSGLDSRLLAGLAFLGLPLAILAFPSVRGRMARKAAPGRAAAAQPQPGVNKSFLVYKAASLYMTLTMLVFIGSALLGC